MNNTADYNANLETLVEVNDILADLDACFLSPVARALPSQYSFGVSVLCDIDCPYCPRQTYGDTIDSGLMDIDVLLRCESYLKFSRYTGLFGLGEPFLHSKFLDMVEIVKKAGGHAATSTHGMSLKEKVIPRLIESGLDELEVSIDAATPRIFNYLRKGADLTTIVNNIQRLQDEKKRRNSKLPIIQIASVISIYNLREIPRLVKLARQLKAEQVIFTNMIITHPENKHISVYPSQALTRLIEKAKSLGRKLGIEVQFFYQKPFPWQREIHEQRTEDADLIGYGCPLIWRSLYVDLNGDVKPCCYYDTVFGNCIDKTPAELFNNDKFRGLRQRLMRGDLPDCCVDCGNLARVTPQYLNRQLDKAGEALTTLKGKCNEEEYETLKKVVENITQNAHNKVS
jgi:MoaA/NifB/PqqE/SkfB family radical SAM enzyme